MVEADGCYYCIRWNKEIGHIYPKTAEGSFAPLMRMDIRDSDNGDIQFERAVNFTPTFVLIDDDKELARIEGYPGEDFFWFLLEEMLTDQTEFEG
jgi:thioredoxin-related protein